MDVWLDVCMYVWMDLERADLNDSVFQAEQLFNIIYTHIVGHKICNRVSAEGVKIICLSDYPSNSSLSTG